MNRHYIRPCKQHKIEPIVQNIRKYKKYKKYKEDISTPWFFTEVRYNTVDFSKLILSIKADGEPLLAEPPYAKGYQLIFFCQKNILFS